MDRSFLEFWGKFLVSAAQGQKQLEDLAKWMAQGLNGFESLTALFRACYGLDKLKESTPGYLKMAKKAQQEFYESFKAYLNLFGVVPKEEYLALVKRYEELKDRAASQEETIHHLRVLVGERVSGQGQLIQAFEELVSKQTDQFQDLMHSLGKLFKKETSSARSAKKGSQSQVGGARAAPEER